MEFFAESTCSENAETPAEGLRAWGNGWVDADTSFTWPIGTCRPSGDTRAPYVVQTCSTSGSTPPSSVDTEATTTSFTPVTISGQLQYVTSSTYANDPTCTLSDSFVSHEMYPQGACLYDPDFSSYGVVTCEEDGRVTMRHFSDRSCRNEMQVDVGVRVGAGRVPDGDGAECLADGFGTYTKVVCEGKLTEGNLLNVQGRVPRRGLMV
ncbi:hypothetical protein HKX48_003286 [Thoreauomyces humboldtii]|nr:hypothetical protein HKX48_003286 [Thoreauomyces humboldtii]